MKKIRIVIYADPASHVAISYLEEELRRVIGPGLEVAFVTARDILNGAALGPDVRAFILPGISGEKSLYHEHLGAEGNGIIRDYVEKGGVFFGLCAGAYYAASTIEYVPAWGPAKGRNAGILALFNGLARGPVPGLGACSITPDAGGCTAAPVILNDGKKGKIAYSCGPAFYGVPENAEILALYDSPAKPVAVFSFKAGKGTVLLSGILPHYGAPGNGKKPEHSGWMGRLTGELAPHEGARRRLWEQMLGVILQDTRRPKPEAGRPRP